MKGHKSLPVDIDGKELSVGDPVVGTLGGFPGETGLVMAVDGLVVRVKLDRNHITWRCAASLWRKKTNA